MELRIPSSVESIDVAMDSFLVAERTKRFTAWQSHEIVIALQAVNRTRQFRFVIDPLAVGDLFESLPERRESERFNEQSASYHHHGDEEGAFEKDWVHMLINTTGCECLWCQRSV